MLIKCIHGYFKFYEQKPGQVSEFMNLTGLELVPMNDYYTFSALKDAPKYSLTGSPYINIPAIFTFEGEPWDIMRKNLLVFDFRLGVVVPKISVVKLISMDQARNHFITTGLILPGSLTDRGTRVTDYTAWYLFDTQRFKYTEFEYE